MADPRFDIANDPRFRKESKSEKLKLDDRFTELLGTKSKSKKKKNMGKQSKVGKNKITNIKDDCDLNDEDE